MNFVRIALPALLCLAIVPAAAEIRPRLVPAHDVTVEYTVNPAEGPALNVRVEILAGGQKLLVTSPELPTTVLVNRGAGTADIMLPLLRAYSEIGIGHYDPENTVLRGASFTRAGAARVAGRDCTFWRARSPQGTALACVTDDGVILQGTAQSARRGGLGSVRASRVAYGVSPPQAFHVPEDYQESPVRLDSLGLSR